MYLLVSCKSVYRLGVKPTREHYTDGVIILSVVLRPRVKGSRLRLNKYLDKYISSAVRLQYVSRPPGLELWHAVTWYMFRTGCQRSARVLASRPIGCRPRAT